MLGFLFGLALGASMSSTPQASMLANQIMAQIPIRCIAAFEQDEDAYKRCRKVAIAGELANNSRLRPDEVPLCVQAWQESYNHRNEQIISEWAKGCNRDEAIAWEIAALHALKTEFEKTKKP